MVTHSSILAWKIPWTEEPIHGYSPWGCKELDTTKPLSTLFLRSGISGNLHSGRAGTPTDSSTSLFPMVLNLQHLFYFHLCRKFYQENYGCLAQDIYPALTSLWGPLSANFSLIHFPADSSLFSCQELCSLPPQHGVTTVSCLYFSSKETDSLQKARGITDFSHEFRFSQKLKSYTAFCPLPGNSCFMYFVSFILVSGNGPPIPSVLSALKSQELLALHAQTP